MRCMKNRFFDGGGSLVTVRFTCNFLDVTQGFEVSKGGTKNTQSKIDSLRAISVGSGGNQYASV